MGGSVHWQLLTKVYHLDERTATLASCVAITTPTLPFILAFSTIAYAIGVGFFLLMAFAWMISRTGKFNLLYAGILGGAAIAIYQTFIFALFILVAFSVILASNEKFYTQIKKGSFSIFLSLMTYVITDKMVRWLFRVKSAEYVENFVNTNFSLESLWSKVQISLQYVIDVIFIAQEKFGIHHPWLAVLFASVWLGALYKILTGPFRHKFFRILLLLAITSIPLFAEFLSSYSAPLRSQVYFPLLMLVLAGFGMPAKHPFFRLFIFILAFLVVVNNSVVANHLFNASDIAYQLDSRLASKMYDTLKTQYAMSDNTTYTLEVVGQKSWPASNLLSKSETFGASFFEWDEGNRYRVAAFLALHGIPVVGASEAVRIKSLRIVQGMPAYPTPGWIVLDGTTIILKFGDYTPSQKQSLCANGAVELCN